MCEDDEIFDVIAITDDSAYSEGTFSTREKAEACKKRYEAKWMQYSWVYRWEISKKTIQ